MASYNSISLVGNLGRAPEVKHTQSNVTVANFSIATSERWKDKVTGEWQEKTQWHRVVAWAGLGEKAGGLVKGQQVLVIGRLEYRKWAGKDGVEKEVAEIIADKIVVLGKREPAAAAEVGSDLADLLVDGGDLPF